MGKKGEAIKKAFLGNAAISKVVPDQVYRDRLAASITLARGHVQAAEVELQRLPTANKTRAEQQVVSAQLSADLDAEETAGQTNAVRAWKHTEALVERAAALRAFATRRVATIKRTIASVDHRAKALRLETAAMRKDRRDTLNDRTAARLETQIAQLEDRIDQTLTDAQSDPDAAMSTLDGLEDTAQLLRGGTRTAIAATPEGQRKESRRTTDAVLGALGGATGGQAGNRLGQLLAQADSEPDRHGLTLKDQISAVLEVFDDQFAKAPDASPDAQRDNTAMRVAAMASAMALRLVKQQDINDPQLKPVVARSIVQEYGAELARSLASKNAKGQDAKAIAAEEAKVKEALKLAEALLAEDPVLKLFTGKITGPHAVEALRRQAEAAGVAPSRMLALQRQQLEMRVASMSAAQVKAGELERDLALKVNAKGEMIGNDGKPVDDPARQGREQQGFVLNDLYGELSPADLQRLVSYRQHKPSVERMDTQATTPAMRPKTEGGGLEYQPTGKQEHAVRKGDTLQSVARQLCGPTANDAALKAKIDDILKLNKFVFWTEQRARLQARLEDYLPAKPLPVGAVLTLAGTSGVLDQLADYVAAWDTPALPDPPADEGRLERERFQESLNIRGKLSQLKEREATGKVAPKVTAQALAQGASRLLPPIRPEVTNELKALVAQIKQLDALEAKKKKAGGSLSPTQLRQRKALAARAGELKQKLETFRTLAATLSTMLKTQARAVVEQTDDFKAYEALRLEFADPAFRQAPGLGQDHGLGGVLDDAQAEGRAVAQRQQRAEELREALKPARVQSLVNTLKALGDGVDIRQAPAFQSLAALLGEKPGKVDPAHLMQLAGAFKADLGHPAVAQMELELASAEADVARHQQQQADAARVKELTAALKPARVQTLMNALKAMGEGTDIRTTREFQSLAVLLDEKPDKLDPTRLMQLAGRFKADLNDPALAQLTKELGERVARQEMARSAEREAGHEGAMNERQYAHLKLLDRWDQDEKERFQAETGETVEAYVTRRLKELLKFKKDAEAKAALDTAFRNVARVPLTITFRAESLFSDSTKDEPAHGTAYVSDAVYTRKDVDLGSLIGRGNAAAGKVAVTGGHKTQKDTAGQDVEAAWSAGRGKNYMRWRTDKDDREAHQDRLPFEDQQLFGAANPNWEKTHGGTKEEKPDGSFVPGAEVPVSSNYYGNAHFLLKDAVRKRVAYITRGQNSEGGGKTAFQRKDFLMLFHDMIKGHDANQRYLKALLTIGEKDYVATSIAWEFHLYGGFDIRHDAQAIYLADVVEPEARARIERFAAKHGITVIGSKPQGVAVAHDGSAVAVEL